ncbi:DUF4873 domain-containing protein [Blastococcus sp. CT_GayMR19]|uniref:DUF4873 domain-containing protein n=1 Tax=Blastococcus sp. CT_GayMR19 TaxID=2559608 RepID=UPI00107475E3|nr:DUF4873 domain-containing protein [Blastococcus sp. CT_GayMR19]TFV75561.1 DUF4873 domain-containing protein [Blastococcus sp. CT_GayMR19]
MSEHEQPDGYEGVVTVVVEGEEPRTAHAALAARFDPLAGHVVWKGRVSAGLPARTPLVLRTLHGSGSAEAVERDPWGNTRVRGVGRPPFPVELLDAASGTGPAR